MEEGRRGRSQERRSDNKENEADNNMPEKKEIKIQGGGILDRLASLQKSSCIW